MDGVGLQGGADAVRVARHQLALWDTGYYRVSERSVLLVSPRDPGGEREETEETERKRGAGGNKRPFLLVGATR